jgi:hypothetical protein
MEGNEIYFVPFSTCIYKASSKSEFCGACIMAWQEMRYVLFPSVPAYTRRIKAH